MSLSLISFHLPKLLVRKELGLGCGEEPLLELDRMLPSMEQQAVRVIAQ